MKKNFLSAFAALLIPLVLAPLAQAETPGVRDAANMFSADARNQANEQLEHVYKSAGWPVVIETVESLGGKPVDDLALDKARSIRIPGVYVLLANKDHKISIQVHDRAKGVFNSEVRESLKQTITSAFKQKKYDQGLLDGVAYLSKVASEHPIGSSAVRAARPGDAAPPAADRPGNGSLLMTILVIGGVVLIGLFVIRLIAGAGRPGMGGMGSPGGGGFLSSLFGAMGGVFLGNWLYNTFSGGHAQASDSHRTSDWGADANDHYESTSGGWDSSGDTGGDGGFDGGDFGAGGGDFGGGDMGGGDW